MLLASLSFLFRWVSTLCMCPKTGGWTTGRDPSVRKLDYSESLKSGHLSVPIADIRLHDLCSKLGYPICLKSGQTKLGRCGNLGS